MKKIIYLLLILIVGFTGCDGRKSQKKSLLESVDVFNQKNNIIITNYIPKNYQERQIDTTLSNGFYVKIITKTNMMDDVAIIKERNNIKYSTNYRQFNFSIDVKNKGHQIYYKLFDKKAVIKAISKLKNYETNVMSKDFKKLAVLHSIQLNQELSTKNDSVYIDIAYAEPNDDDLDWLTLKINKNGTSDFIQFIN